MKTLNVILSFAVAVTLAKATLAGTACTASSEHSDHTNTDSALFGDADGYCTFTPQSMKVKIYEFGLCTGPSSPIGASSQTDKSACTTLFSSPTGTEIDLAVGLSANLTDGVTLAEGTYSNAYLVLSNVTSLKGSHTFSSPRTDLDGNSGTICYTDGRSVDDPNTESIITCGASDAAVHSVETIRFGDIENNVHNAELLDYQVSVAGTNVVTDLYMVDSSGVLSTAFSDDFAIYGDQTLTAPVSITPTTRGLDVGISITNAIALGFMDPSDGDCEGGRGTKGCPDDALFMGLKFLVSSN